MQRSVLFLFETKIGAAILAREYLCFVRSNFIDNPKVMIIYTTMLHFAARTNKFVTFLTIIPNLFLCSGQNDALSSVTISCLLFSSLCCLWHMYFTQPLATVGAENYYCIIFADIALENHFTLACSVSSTISRSLAHRTSLLTFILICFYQLLLVSMYIYKMHITMYSNTSINSHWFILISYIYTSGGRC